MKSSWIGIGFSHQSVPSLSNTAKRSSTGTGSRPSPPLTRSTNATIARFAGPSRQLARAFASVAGVSSVAAMDRTVRSHRGRQITPIG